MTRVMIDCRMAHWSGVGRYTRGLVGALTEVPGLDLILVKPTEDQASGLLGDLHSVTAAHHPFSVRGARELSALIAEQSPDVVHCLHFPTPSRADGPLVVTIHDLTPLLVPGVMPSVVRRVVYRCANARAVSKAARIIVPSAATERDLLRRYRRSLGKTVVIPEAADEFAAGQTGELPGEFHTCIPYILTMGNVRPHKDLPTLLAAFAPLVLTHPDLHLLLVGPDVPGYLGQHLPSDVRPRARFTGRVSDADLRSLYANAAAFAFPSRYEGFGLPPLEAMALGAPVVAARAASVPEVVGDAALLVEPGDVQGFSASLGSVLTSSTVRKRLIDAGHKRVEDFTWARTAQQTVAVYEDLLTAARR